jgi:hypothetical protein
MLMHTPFPTGLSGVRDLRAKKRSSSNSSRQLAAFEVCKLWCKRAGRHGEGANRCRIGGAGLLRWASGGRHLAAAHQYVGTRGLPTGTARMTDNS